MTRSGIGWDSHRLAMGRELVLGGVVIAHDRGLDGHSDADVLTHAVIDALLGAAGLGDIGQHFPDSDPAYEGADSLELLRSAVAIAARAGWRPVYADATVVMERPRLGPSREAIAANLADALGAAVNVKATTGEGIGFVGREEGVAALAVVTVEEAR
ncbi:MAG TPA: 2-C-methyl-D-erythritol 2,4-cyclodiphosphate synthase [Solirubrobacteraceae bacterium]|jgi:2-C-methyl-D-erythritol 2,4-cyclodiphosphate synthase|nr:2-C-methyl-D-erythritol 2,4-cyclodiphosphate synthase [Solirubrobacteraceae bacterium]